MLTHEALHTARLQIEQLDAWALGRLMADAWRAFRPVDPDEHAHATPITTAGCGVPQRFSQSDLAGLILVRTHGVPPRYATNSATDLLSALNETPTNTRDVLGAMAGVVEGLATALTDEHRLLMRKRLMQLPAIAHDSQKYPLHVALDVIAGLNALQEVSLSPLRDMELRNIAHIAATRPQAAINAAREVSAWSDALDDEALAPPGHYPLAQLPEFVMTAQPAIEAALTRIHDVQRGQVPYVADKALPYDDAHALARFVSVALDRNEPWLAALLQPLLMGVAVAPIATAKTLPSQAAAIGLAKAIAERPTLDAVAILKTVLTSIRHAGVLKKLQRLTKLAERRLAARADLIINLPPNFAAPKSLLGALRQSFEQLYLNRRTFDRHYFETTLLNSKGVAEMAQALIWRTMASDGTAVSVQPVKTRNKLVWRDASGALIELAANAMLQLWHPLTASETELACWQTRILDEGVQQPFNQAFRETYPLTSAMQQQPSLDGFAGHAVDIRKLMGLALTTGWVLARHEGFHRNVGDLRFVFDCGDLYPGMQGVTKTGNLSVTRHGQLLLWSQIDAELCSEVLRSVDLLVSVAAFAIDAEAPVSDYWPGAHAAQSRRQVLCRWFGQQQQPNRPWVEGRYLRIGEISIHIATGQARRAGVPLQLDSLKGVTTLPYADPILEKIIVQANRLTAP